MRNLVILCALSATLSGCATMEGGQPINLLSTQQEVQLGAQMAAQVEQQSKPYPDAAVQAYVRDIGARLAAAAPRQDVQYQFSVIDDPDTINAFALPGGYMYVYTGLMKFCDNEAELASVMAHEIAHVAAHHHGEMMTRQYGYNTIASLLLGNQPGAMAQMVAQILGQGYAMRFSRANEAEADALGMDILFRAGYQPVAMLTFMNKMVQLEQQSGGRGPGLAIFASHPPSTERLARLDAQLNRYPEEMRAQRSVQADRYRQIVLSRLRTK